MQKEIYLTIEEWKEESGIKSSILIGRFIKNKTLTIITDKPGLMIGCHGSLVDKYRKKLKNINQDIQHIEFLESDERIL